MGVRMEYAFDETCEPQRETRGEVGEDGVASKEVKTENVDNVTTTEYHG